ncbi:hypothetical protein BT69DRAFT_1276585 [Atractiella rhizophila]|nr:hypothetical protein BT69DRAFT_1276585 [Atractiella rhizophila]
MTSIDPSHFPSSSSKRGEAIHTSVPPLPHAGPHKSRIPLPPIPDLRFEQGYLKSLSPFISVKNGKELSKRNEHLADDTEQVALVSEGPYKAWLEEEEELEIQWKSVLYITFRDQLLSPLLQGAVWGVGSLLLATSLLIIRRKFPFLETLANPRRWWSTLKLKIH